MGGHSPEEIRAETRTYMMVFAALAVLTIITVAISYLDLSTGPAVALGLFVAAIKGSLVACYFMHLLDEKKTIYGILALTMVFFVMLMMVSATNALGRADVENPGAASVPSEEHHEEEGEHVP